MDATARAIISSVISTIIGSGIVAAVLTEIFARCREKKKRQKDFLAFVKSWQASVYSPRDDMIGGFTDLPKACIIAYQGELSAFQSQIILVKDDFAKYPQFLTLTGRIANLNAKDWEKKQPRDVICQAIDDLIHFLES